MKDQTNLIAPVGGESEASAPADDGGCRPNADAQEDCAFLEAMKLGGLFGRASRADKDRALWAMPLVKGELAQPEAIVNWRRVGEFLGAALDSPVTDGAADRLWHKTIVEVPDAEQDEFWQGCVFGGNFEGHEAVWRASVAFSQGVRQKACLAVVGMANPLLVGQAVVMMEEVFAQTDKTMAYEFMWYAREAAWAAEQKKHTHLAEDLRQWELALSVKAGLPEWKTARVVLGKIKISPEEPQQAIQEKPVRKFWGRLGEVFRRKIMTPRVDCPVTAV